MSGNYKRTEAGEIWKKRRNNKVQNTAVKSKSLTLSTERIVVEYRVNVCKEKCMENMTHAINHSYCGSRGWREGGYEFMTRPWLCDAECTTLQSN